MKKLLIFLFACNYSFGQVIQLPLKASSNQKYLVDQGNKPVFLKGDAAWRLSYNVTLVEVREYLADRKEKGFNTVIVEITPDLPGKEHGNQPNIYGEYVFMGKDIGKPNEKFFLHVDSVLNLCAEMNFTVLLFPLYLGCCQDGWIEILHEQQNTVDKCREYGKWVAGRYKKLPNIIWMSGGDHNETPESIACAEGIAEVDVSHLHSYHAGPGSTSTERLPNAKWLTLGATYTYFPAMDQNWDYLHVYAQLYHEGKRNNRIPFFMSESAYENERNEPTQFLRRQAYWALLGGACGHIFGNRDTWQMNKNWKNALNTVGNQSMKIFYSFVETIPWYSLRPDWSHNLFTEGRGNFNPVTSPGGDDYATGAFSEDKRTAILYMPTYRIVGVNMNRFPSKVSARWFDPSSGKHTSTNRVFENSGIKYFTPPAVGNSQGFGDWVLILESKP